MEVVQNSISEPVDFSACSICGRSFNPEVLPRHERVCAKNQQTSKKRTVFDTAKKRREGTELQSFLASRPSLKTNKPSTAEIKASEKKKNWRRKHEDFIQSIRSAREYTEAETTGARLPSPKLSQPNPDYVQCPHCERRFEQYSAERHIPFCKEQHSRIEIKLQANKGMQKLSKRIQYKPPSLKKKSSASQQSSVSASKPPHPAGYHLVARNTNFRETYTVDENSPERQNYHRPGKLGSNYSPMVKATVPKAASHGRLSSNTSATLAGDLPGSVSEPGVRGHAGNHSDTGGGGGGGRQGGGSGVGKVSSVTRDQAGEEKKLRRRRSLLKTPQPIAAAYQMGHVTVAPSYGSHMDNIFEERGGGGGGGMGLGRHIREITVNEGSRYSSSSSLGEGEPPRLGPVKPKGRSKRALRAPEDPPLSHDDIPVGHRRTEVDFGSRGEQPRIGSGSSLNSNKGAPLNKHGMTMSKFCYECGNKYPVPQAKYCCECGTQRI